MPIWAGVAISAGVGLYSAHKQASAAKDAAKTQAASGDKALALQSDIYNQTRNDLAPYRGAGTAALGSEMSLLGLNPAAMGTLGGSPSMVGGGSAGGPAYGVTGPTAPAGMKGGAVSDPNANGGYAGQMPGSSTLGAKGSVANNTSSYGPHDNPVPNLRVQGPDGNIYVVPADQASDAQSNGGKVLGPA